MRMIIVATLLALQVAPASAQEWWQHSRRHYYRVPERHYYRDEDDRAGCRDRRSVVGDQHLTIDGAKKAANDAWAGAVRFHLGEKFMDLNFARGIDYVCSRSSIKEASATTLGQSLTRCEISARPCPATHLRPEDQ
jgi:hypothetical protein